jgi:hypothetical protein
MNKIRRVWNPAVGNSVQPSVANLPWLSTPPTSFTERHLNPLQNKIVDFEPLPKGCLPQPLIERLGQVNAGMTIPGRPCRLLGLAGTLATGGGVRCAWT